MASVTAQSTTGLQKENTPITVTQPSAITVTSTNEHDTNATVTESFNKAKARTSEYWKQYGTPAINAIFPRLIPIWGYATDKTASELFLYSAIVFMTSAAIRFIVAFAPLFIMALQVLAILLVALALYQLGKKMSRDVAEELERFQS